MMIVIYLLAITSFPGTSRAAELIPSIEERDYEVL